MGILLTVSTRERPLDKGRHRARELEHRVGFEIRRARIASGWSQRELGRRVGISHTEVGRIERGQRSCSIRRAAELCAMLGLELSLSCYPVATPARDAAHLALLDRFRQRLDATIAWRTEVPMPQRGDLRSIDGVFRNDRTNGMTEAETRLWDIQSTERRARLKLRDSGLRRLILLVADTRANREFLSTTPGVRERFPISARAALAALGRGDDPGGDAIVVL